MIELYPGLFVGDQSTCLGGFDGLSVVHACKSPAINRPSAIGVALPHDDRCYLALETPYDLFLNLDDPPTPLFRLERAAPPAPQAQDTR